MIRYLLLATVLISLNSCKKDGLTEEFNCKKLSSTENTKEIRDVLKKFKVYLPKYWKTELYYDEFQSEIYSADTTKSLTETYILDVSWHQGELNLNKSFDQTVIDTLAMKEGLHLVKSNFNKFKNKPSYWNLSKGKSGDYTIHYLQVYVKTEIDEYFTISTKFFGDNDITDKLCASVSLFDQIKFIE
jgi:hypothetical protein